MKTQFDYKKFGKAINRMRWDLSEDKMVTMEDIGNECGISHCTVFRASKGKSVTLDNAIKICSWLNLPITEFIN